MRLPYAPSTPPPTSTPTEQEIYAAVRARRAPRPLQKLDLALLHTPPIASGWNGFLGAIRSRSILPGASVQEVAICRIAVLNRAPYEWDAHALLAVQGDDAVSSEGLRSVLSAPEFVGGDAVARLEEVGARMDGMRRQGDDDDDDGRGSEGDGTKNVGGLSARQWAVVAFTDQSTRNVQIDDRIWDLVKEHFTDREMVELTATVAAYNCVSRFLGALDVGERNGGDMPIPEGAK